MKKHIFFAVTLTAILLSQSCFAQRASRQAPPPIPTTEHFVISGTWERAGNATQINLYQIVYGRLERVSVGTLQADRSFTLAFTPQTEGFFVVGTGNPAVRADQYTFWMKPGDHLRIAVNDSTYTLVGNQNSAENVAMKAWHDFIQPLEQSAFYWQRFASMSYTEFFRLLEEKIQNPFVAQPTGNRAFDELFAKYRQFDLIHCAVQLLMIPRSRHPRLEDFPNFYRELKVQNFDNTDILIFPYRLLPNILFIQNKFTEEDLIAGNPGIALMGMLTNDTLKGEIFLNDVLASIRELPRMQEANTQFAKYITTDDQQRRFEREIERVNRLHLEHGIGNPGLDFTYRDVNGNEVSFSDFRGRVVYLNVWATWCAPCRAEIPHKKRIEEHFAGNDNIVFVGVSIDNPRDIQRWKDFVASNELGGVQLHGNIGGPMDIRTLYGITGIPRFMLFDKQGNIVSIDAPRPSSPEIIPLLTRLLEQR
ncbi:MAG: TlpA family protein disulfide reductase [Bacteroidales bacterium]|nr:TlpA family protein disulfide reductase [Bacteroidales bacterium]